MEKYEETDEKVKDYFERAAKDFDDIYDNEGGIVKKIANKIFRKGMAERFNVTMQLCGYGKKNILDIGCGAGRFCIPLAEKGMNVTGIDYSNEMIRLAKDFLAKYCQKHGKNLKINYACCDFLNDFNPKNKFDISIAMGVFDYVMDPIPLLGKMKSVTKGATIASFPAKYTPQMPIRTLWLATKNCPVYFYTKNQIRDIYKSVGLDCKIISVKAGYVVVARND